MGRAQGEVSEGAIRGAAMKHEWFKSKFGFVCCRTCMIVQNDKNRDAECKGAAPITLRDRIHG